MSTDPMRDPVPAGTAVRCPGCGSSHTAAAITPVQHNVLCKTCGTCWNLAGGNAERVDPHQCPKCSLSRICAVAAVG